jgi:DNA topoisomerase I
MSKLVIVESPGKLKKIREILGDDYLVEASVGHIIELSDKYSEDYKFGINLNTYIPDYKQCENKKQVIAKLIALCKKIGKENVLLAADEDREGEMIAWSVAKELHITNPVRIVFNSITSKELKNAIKNKKEIDMNLFHAQQARAVLDKFAGFLISPILKRSGCIGARSAGRVQSVATKINVDRHKEIINFFEKENPTYFYINSDVQINEYKLLTKLVSSKQIIDIKDDIYDPLLDNESINKQKNNKQNEIDDEDKTYTKLEDEKTTTEIIKAMSKSIYELDNIKEKIRKSNPPPPFSTSTLQQFTTTRMKIGGKETMEIAQKLYEAGYITYMRTDSTSISEEAMVNIKKYIEEKYGNNYHLSRVYKNKKNNTQEAHECIRPTKISVENIKGKANDNDKNKEKIIDKQEKLYHAIWKRTIQSQMSSAEYNDIIIEIKMKSKKSKSEDNKLLSKYKLIGSLETLVFEGFLILDGKTPKNKLNSKKLNDASLEWLEINGIENCKKPPTRYNEASLINKMDPSNLNIGRPSTYASIIETIQKREYVKIQDIEGKKIQMKKLNIKSSNPKEIIRNIKDMILGKETKKFVPTELGIKVTEFLEENFSKLMDYKFTEQMEKDLDKVACGKMKRYDVVDVFYKYLNECLGKLKITNNNNNNNNGNGICIGTHEEEDILLLNGEYGKFIKHKKTIINFAKLINAYNLKLKNDNDENADESYNSNKTTNTDFSVNSKNNKKIANAFIKELGNPIIKNVSNTVSLYEWKNKRTKYVLKKSKNNSYYVEEKGQDDKTKMMFSLKFIMNKISKEKELEINDKNINEICSNITNEDVINAKQYFDNLKKK